MTDGSSFDYQRVPIQVFSSLITVPSGGAHYNGNILDDFA